MALRPILRQPCIPTNRGDDPDRGPHRGGDGHSRLDGDPPHLRRERQRSLPCTGIRPCTGPLLPDGFLEEDLVRGTVDDVRGEPGRHGHLHQDNGLGPSRRGPVPARERREQGRSGCVCSGGQRLPGYTVPCRSQLRVHRPRVDQPQLHTGAMDRGTVARMGQGDGVGPRRQHGGRDPTCARSRLASTGSR